jgi:hypothetical protein
LTVGIAGTDPKLRHRTAAADHRHVVAGCAPGAVEERSETFGRLLDLAEILEAEAELFELARRDAGQWIAGPAWRLSRHPERGHPHEPRAGQQIGGSHFTTSVARIAV